MNVLKSKKLHYTLKWDWNMDECYLMKKRKNND